MTEALDIDSKQGPSIGSRRPGRSRRWASVRHISRVYVAPRVATIIVMSIVVFAAVNAIGVGVAQKALGRSATPAELAAFNVKYGLNRSLPEQYITWIGHLLTGNWGISPISGQPIEHAVLVALGRSLILAAAAILISVPLSLGLGVYLSKRPGRLSDLVLNSGTLVLAATPLFVLGLVLVYIFSVELKLTPVDSTGLIYGGAGAHVAAYILPTVTLALSLVPHFTRITRASMRETLAAPYAHAGVLRGLGGRTLTWRYLLPNAAPPIVNVIALELMWVVGGVVVVEAVFAFPGIGSLFLSAINSGDLLTVEAIAIVTGTIFVLISLAADLIVLALNPRLRRA